jgi:hypothetical protein
MPKNDKVMIGTSGDWVRVKDNGHIELAIGEDGETDAKISMDQWETFQVIQKLAEVSGLYLDRTGAQGLIIKRPENPKEVERRNELAAVLSNWDSLYKDLPESTQNAIEHIIRGEIERGEL